jgi:drug/metabolite transporter (DMT)-like permease
MTVVFEGRWGILFAGTFGSPGDILILISAANWAVFSALSRRGLKEHPALWMLLYVMGLGWIFISVFLFAGPGVSEIGQLGRSGWQGIVFLGIACSGLAYIFWYDGLQAVPVSQVGAFLYLEPLVAVVVAGLVLNEKVLPASLIGGVAILLGVWLVNRKT